MRTIAFIIPWGGGVLPDYFPLWLETARNNRSIDFLLFTDDQREFDYPENVKRHHMGFPELKRLFQEKYNFPIALEEPYKFCDFRPAYGDIFSEYLVGYDFWGHCDIDMLWGDIRNFITEDVLEQYGKVYSRGHCSLYRNVQVINTWYKDLPSHGYQEWKTVFQCPHPCCFDEWGSHCGGGISCIIKANEIEFYDLPDMADLDVSKGYFKINRWEGYEDKSLYFSYADGRLFSCSAKGEKEVIYCHFQKRGIVLDVDIDMNHLFFVAPGLATSDVGKVKRHMAREAKYLIKYYISKVEKKWKERRFYRYDT